jgi:hypothetical protein
MPNDHEFKPVEAQLTVFYEQRKRCARKVENGFLDVSEKRHAVEREWIPERNFAHGHRNSSKIPRRVVMIQEIFPEERISEQDITEEYYNKNSQQRNTVPVFEIKGDRARR